jgi:hypothetical protein
MTGEEDEGRVLLWIFLGRRQRFVSVGYFRQRTLGLGVSDYIGKSASLVGSFSPNLGVDALGAHHTWGSGEPTPLLQKSPAVSIGSLEFRKGFVQQE